MERLHKLDPAVKPAPGARAIVRIGERCVALFNVAGELFAIDDSCPHAGSSLASGKVEHGAVQCPAHGLRFDLASGCMRGGPLSIRTYSVSQADSCLVITLPESESQ
ncbi:MAG: Rieske 2Fe-2S domain-containing protein [Burkholderiaceae bacterium]|nr:Rieske 2Fe-2S domain-containing protein [Burkholderiaceae bacterium]